MNLGPFGDPITPAIEAAKSTAAHWPAITTFAIVNFVSGFVASATPGGNSMADRFIQAGVEGALDIYKFAAWDAVKKT